MQQVSRLPLICCFAALNLDGYLEDGYQNMWSSYFGAVLLLLFYIRITNKRYQFYTFRT